jgi:hypothetical protein
MGQDIINVLSKKDYYLVNPPQKPKAEIAKYVESYGILVPKRFDSLKEAIET